MMTKVWNPTGTVQEVKSRISPRIGDLNGKVLGILDNGKPNFDLFAARLEELLRRDFNFADVVHLKKGTLAPHSRLPQTAAEEFAARCDVVINGSCD
jgi:hypothetical protein